jgi:hypothetical protein
VSDLISRAAAIAKVERARKAARTLTGMDFVMMLKDQPAVDAVPVVHARWILIQNGTGICSACNRNDHIDSLAAYCRYCGAKMDGERREMR